MNPKWRPIGGLLPPSMPRLLFVYVAERAPRLHRTFASSVLARSDAPFSRPGPIPLPKEEQKEFEKLVRDKESA